MGCQSRPQRGGMSGDTPYQCPNCKADLTAGAIPEAIKEHYGGKVSFTRCISIYDIELDKTTSWECPDCGYEWEVDGGSSSL